MTCHPNRIGAIGSSQVQRLSAPLPQRSKPSRVPVEAWCLACKQSQRSRPERERCSLKQIIKGVSGAQSIFWLPLGDATNTRQHGSLKQQMCGDRDGDG